MHAVNIPQKQAGSLVSGGGSKSHQPLAYLNDIATRPTPIMGGYQFRYGFQPNTPESIGSALKGEAVVSQARRMLFGAARFGLLQTFDFQEMQKS